MARTVELPPLLQPQQKMRVNEPCWCGSGRKWKHCHRSREDGEPLNYFQATATLRKSFSEKVCLHPAAPKGCGKVIGAHTLQRLGVLSKIAEAGHVYSCKEGIHQLHETGGRCVPARTGVRRASTFNGFCDAHDGKLFRPIEMGTVPLNATSALLLSIRAIAYETYNKMAAIRADEQLVSADTGRPFEEQAVIQQWVSARLTGLRMGLADTKRQKAKLDQAYLSGDHSGVRMYVVEFEEGLPLVSTGAFFPVRAFDGQPLQSLLETDLDYVAFALTYSGNRSVAVLAWHDSGDGKAEAFAKSFADLPDSDKATAAAVLAFVHIENTHLRPSWWEAVDTGVQSAICDLLGAGGLREQSVTDLSVAHAPFRIEAAVRLTSWM